MGTPTSKVIQDAPYVRVSVDEAIGLITIAWKNFAPSGTYRATLDLAVKLIEEYDLKYFLTDQRRRGPILHDDELWLMSSWVPRMAAAGLKRAAIIQSEDVTNRDSIDRVVSASQPNVPYPIGSFPTMEEAVVWLKQ